LRHSRSHLLSYCSAYHCSKPCAVNMIFSSLKESSLYMSRATEKRLKKNWKKNVSLSKRHFPMKQRRIQKKKNRRIRKYERAAVAWKMADAALFNSVIFSD